MQALSRREETEVIELVKKEALRECDQLVREFAECSRGRTVSVAWACKNELKSWQDCMRIHVSEKRQDDMRLDYIQNRDERGKELVERLKKERIESYKRQAGIKN